MELLYIKKLFRHIILLPVYLYRYFISPLIPMRCRFLPSCSEYAIEAVHTHGVIKGSFLAIKRVSRCHPWGGKGLDPVPEKREKSNE